LGHNSWRRKSEAWEVEYILCWEDYPFAFVDHVDKFLVKKVNILKCGAMRASLGGALKLLSGPWWRCEFDRGTFVRVGA
jgi:hypothetical protein